MRSDEPTVSGPPPSTARVASELVRGLIARLPDADDCLEIVAGPEAGRRLPLPLPGRDLLIGRGETCGAQVADLDLSREHARLRRSWTGLTICDLGSKNGTTVGGKLLAAGEERPLSPGDRVELGQSVLAVRGRRPLAVAVGAPGLGARVVVILAAVAVTVAAVLLASLLS